MALDNFISIELSTPEIDQFNAAYSDMNDSIKNAVINLTPDERKRFARVAYEMIPWIEKCNHYMITNPSLVPAYIDLVEFNKDLKARADLYPMLTKIRSILEMLDDTVLLLGQDLYNNCIAFYQAVKGAAKAQVPGSTAIFQDLQQQFPGRPKSQGGETPPQPPQG
jgi:hypothetical protein